MTNPPVRRSTNLNLSKAKIPLLHVFTEHHAPGYKPDPYFDNEPPYRQQNP